jgi:hypothetical protein
MGSRLIRVKTLFLAHNENGPFLLLRFLAFSKKTDYYSYGWY